jgi:hypothetical protein
MPYEVKWLYEKRIANPAFIGIVTLDDMKNEIAELAALTKTGTPPVHVIVDMSNVERILPGLKQIRQYTPPVSSEIGWIIIVGQNPLVRFLSSISVQLSRANYRFYATTGEALDFLRQRDMDIAAWLEKRSSR